jgi:uncharacterized protein
MEDTGMSRLNPVSWISMALVTVGALNWGLVGLFNFNLVNALFGGIPVIESAVYILVGLAALGMIYTAVALGSKESTRTA